MRDELHKIIDSLCDLEEQLHTVEEVCRLMSHDRLADKVLAMHTQVATIWSITKGLCDQNRTLTPTDAP